MEAEDISSSDNARLIVRNNGRALGALFSGAEFDYRVAEHSVSADGTDTRLQLTTTAIVCVQRSFQ